MPELSAERLQMIRERWANREYQPEAFGELLDAYDAAIARAERAERERDTARQFVQDGWQLLDAAEVIDNLLRHKLSGLSAEYPIFDQLSGAAKRWRSSEEAILQILDADNSTGESGNSASQNSTAPTPDLAQRTWDVLAGWSQETFGADHQRGAHYPLAHMVKEVREAIDADGTEGLTEELADIQLLLWDAARRAGLGLDDLLEATAFKLAANTRRQWGEPDDAGVIEHVREDEPDTMPVADVEVALKEVVRLSGASEVQIHAALERETEQIRRALTGERDVEPEPKAPLTIHRPDDDGTPDDFVIEDVSLFRMERMDKGSWWIAVYRGDERLSLFLNSKKRIRCTISEDELGCVDD